MIDHVSLGVGDLHDARRFYDVLLATLGYRRVRDLEAQSGYGPDESHDSFYIVVQGRDQRSVPGPAQHVAFTAPSRAAVDEFHRAAIEGGGTDDGGPGLRPRYHAGYYAAYVVDPDGNRLEAVCHEGGP